MPLATIHHAPRAMPADALATVFGGNPATFEALPGKLGRVATRDDSASVTA